MLTDTGAVCRLCCTMTIGWLNIVLQTLALGYVFFERNVCLFSFSRKKTGSSIVSGVVRYDRVCSSARVRFIRW